MRRNLRLKGFLRPAFYFTFIALFVSGVAWLYLNSLERDALRTTVLGFIKLHGALAIVSLVLLGWLIPTHIQTGWRRKENRLTGLILSIGVCLLIFSGYGLYYFGEKARAIAQWIHIIIGCAFPFIIGSHIWIGRKKNKKKKKS